MRMTTTDTNAETTMSLPTFENADLHHRGTGRAPIVALGGQLAQAAFFGLLPCDDWAAAEYRMPVKGLDLAVNVEITGKTRVFWNGGSFRRAQITFVGDCEPDSTVKGWVRVT